MAELIGFGSLNPERVFQPEAFYKEKLVYY